MNIIIQGKKDQYTPDAMVEKKVEMLSRYLGTIKDMVVDVSHDHHHNKGNVVTVEMTAHLLCHGNAPLRAHEVGGDIHEALDGAIQKMKHLLSTHKDKEDHVDRSAIREASGKN